jgi:glyoxylase-like metal-dependent hydrolase (beta-lactamase superfamily II)
MERVDDGAVSIYVDGPVGFGNNIYIVVDRTTGAAAFVDAPGELGDLEAAATTAGVTPRTILLTHGHRDHTSCLAAAKAHFGAAVYAAPNEPGVEPEVVDTEVRHGDAVMVGAMEFRCLSVPGHTPGSTTFVLGNHAFVGDTLFPGGPGHSRSNELLRQEIASILTELYILPDETAVWPGHGANTTIGLSKAEYEVFAAKEHAPDLHGDVLWLEA